MHYVTDDSGFDYQKEASHFKRWMMVWSDCFGSERRDDMHINLFTRQMLNHFNRKTVILESYGIWFLNCIMRCSAIPKTRYSVEIFFFGTG